MTYNDISDITKIMAGRDLLFIAYLPQFAVILLLIIRMIGIDLKKFGFQNDEEYLEIKEEDREEFEVNFEFDKDKIKRQYNKLVRSLKYLYLEHKFIINTLITIVVVIIVGYTYYYFGILHKVYVVPEQYRHAIAARLKVMAELDIAEKRLPQDGHSPLHLQLPGGLCPGCDRALRGGV